jgi:hypothetical protein
MEVMAVKKGLVVGVAVGGLIYVMWRRRRAAEAPPEPAYQPPAPPPPVAEEPVPAEAAPDTSATDEEVTEELEEAPPGEPIAEPAAAAVLEPAPAAPARRDEPTLHHPGRRLPLTSSGFASRPRITTFGGSDRPQSAQARISWPGTGGPAAQRPRPLKLVPTRARPAALRRSR